MRILAIPCILLFLMLFLPISASGQTGGLLIRVKGPSGPIPGADITFLYAGRLAGRGVTDGEGNVQVDGLPPGSYSVRVEAMGYTQSEEERVLLENDGLHSLEVFLEIAPVELEGFTFRTERTQVNLENVEFATEIAEEAIRRLPVSRNIHELVALTPGARSDHVWGGASAQANSYRLDGLSVNNPGAGSNLINLSPDWIESIDIRGLGAGAEYGGFQGGLVDIVTKRGTNRMFGSVRSTVEHDGLTGSNLVSSEIGREVAGRFDISGDVGGPVFQDRLFFYLAGQRVEQTSRALNHLPGLERRFSPLSESLTEQRIFGKSTWTPSADDLVEVSGAYFNTQADNHGLSGYEAQAAGTRYVSPIWFLTAEGRRLMGSWGVLEVRANHISSEERYEPVNGTNVPGITHYTPVPPTTTYGNAPYSRRSAPTSTSAMVMGTVRFKTQDLEHSLKVGGEFTSGSFSNSRSRNGEMTWTPERSEGFVPTDPSTWAIPETGEIPTLWGGEVALDADVRNAAAFLQSSLALGSRIVLSPGLRWNQWRGWITPTSGQRFPAVQDKGWDPRIGASLDLTGFGTFVLKAHWGRFHQNLISQMFDRVEGADVFTNEEFWYYSGPPPVNPANAFTPAERDAFAEQGLFRKVGEVVLNETGGVLGYRQPYVDQWLVGLEKKIGSAAKLEVIYSRRSNHEMVALVDQNRDTNYTLFHKVHVMGKPFGGMGFSLKDLRLPNNAVLERLRCLDNGTCPDALPIPGLSIADTAGMVWDPQYVLTTAPNAKREFDQLQVILKLERPTWQGTLSYVRADLTGNLNNVSGYTDPAGYGPGPYVRVNEAENSYGTLEDFSDWEIKASWWGALPLEIQGGLLWTFRTGDHYSPQFRLTSMGFTRFIVSEGYEVWLSDRDLEELDSSLLEPLEGQNIFKGPRGRPTMERQSTVDLRFERTLRYLGRDLGLSLDVFNLFRCEAVTKVNTMINNGPDYWGHLVGAYDGVPDNERYQAPLERVRPQTVRLGFVAYF